MTINVSSHGVIRGGRLIMRLLLDVSNIAWAAHYKLKLEDAEGNSTSVIFGVLRSVKKLIEKIGPDEVVLLYDGSKSIHRRRMFYSDYKLKRDLDAEKVCAKKEVVRQLKIVQLIFKNLPVIQLQDANLEADDLFYCLSGFLKYEDVGYVTRDTDIFQLATAPGHCAIVPSTGEKFKFEMEPYQYAMLKMLAGDSSDSIPGLTSVGEGTAIKLIKQYGTIQAIINHADREGYIEGYRHEVPYDEVLEVLERNEKLIKLGKFVRKKEKLSILNQYKEKRLKLEFKEDELMGCLFEHGFTSIVIDLPAWKQAFLSLIKKHSSPTYYQQQPLELTKIIANPIERYAKLILKPSNIRMLKRIILDKDLIIDDDVPEQVRGEMKLARIDAINVVAEFNSSEGLAWLKHQPPSDKIAIDVMTQKLCDRIFYPNDFELSRLKAINNDYLDQMPRWAG